MIFCLSKSKPLNDLFLTCFQNKTSGRLPAFLNFLAFLLEQGCKAVCGSFECVLYCFGYLRVYRWWKNYLQLNRNFGCGGYKAVFYYGFIDMLSVFLLCLPHLHTKENNSKGFYTVIGNPLTLGNCAFAVWVEFSTNEQRKWSKRNLNSNNSFFMINLSCKSKGRYQKA